MSNLKKVLKKTGPYVLTSLLIFLILTIIFLVKHIYPFGNNSLIWGDMHDQITAFYYHFYDSFKSNSSLLIDFTTSGGVNFMGVLAYYILSPFSFIALLVPRSDVYLVISVIIALKILLCGLTCLYFIRSYYKNLPSLLSVLLAIIYAFSGYALMMYQITPWIDTMYLFPLIMMGLKKVLDLKSPVLYIVTLTLSLIFSFYVNIMALIFILLASFIYLVVYSENSLNRRKGVLALGISTAICILLSLFIVGPSYLQISISSRIGFNINNLLNSKTGPITDKLSMFMFGGLMYIGLFFLLKNKKKNQKFLNFYIPLMLIILLPVIIEPINKIWHFGSYAFFPYRFGFITMFFLIVGACHGFSNYELTDGDKAKHFRMFSIITSLLSSILIFVIIYLNYNKFQRAINTLTISSNSLLLLFLFLALVVCICGCFLLIYFNKKLDNFTLILIAIMTLTHIGINTSIYLGIDYDQRRLMSQYEELNAISKDYQDGDYFRVKNEADNMIMNSGMVMKYHNLDHFTSLTDGNNLHSLKKIGYHSMWVKTSSRGGNLFLDSVLANKYIITREDVNSKYYKLKNTYGDLKFYSLINEPSYGYLISKNDTIFDKDNSFVISNNLYQNITGNSDYLFTIYNSFKTKNIEVTKNEKNKTTNYEIIDADANNYLEKEIKINGVKTVYLEILRSTNHNKNEVMYENFNIYVNDKLFKEKAFDDADNGVLNLGTFENETVNVKIELVKSIDLDNITLGVMDNNKYEKFIKEEKLDTTVSYIRNKINVTLNTDEDKILFLPIAYNKGYKATNNGNNTEVLKVYDNFIGIKLEKGVNNISISYLPTGFKECLIVSIVTLIITVILLVTNMYQKLLDFKILRNFIYYIYLFIYLSLVLFIYIGLTLAFLISYFLPFHF